MRISVAMGTFNGERYLGEQLGSIVQQTRMPDELVVSDDRSSDGTLEVLYRFARSAPFALDISVAPRHLGVTRNYERVIGRCTGDLIVLADQDDRWRADRLEHLESTFKASPSVQLTFSDADLIDADGRPTGYRLWRIRGFQPHHLRRMQRDPFGQLIGRPMVSGCTSAFRATTRSLLMPFPVAEVKPAISLIHDQWISVALAAAFDVTIIPEPLVEYRIHPAQCIGIPAFHIRKVVPRSLFRWQSVAVPQAQHRARLEATLVLLSILGERVERLLEGEPRDKALARIAEGSVHLRARAALPGPRVARLPGVAREIATGRYQRYSLGEASVGADLLRSPGRGRLPGRWNLPGVGRPSGED